GRNRSDIGPDLIAGGESRTERAQLLLDRVHDELPRPPLQYRCELGAAEQSIDRRDRAARVRHGHRRNDPGIVSGGAGTVSGGGSAGGLSSNCATPAPVMPCRLTMPVSVIVYVPGGSGLSSSTTISRTGRSMPGAAGTGT